MLVIRLRLVKMDPRQLSRFQHLRPEQIRRHYSQRLAKVWHETNCFGTPTRQVQQIPDLAPSSHSRSIELLNNLITLEG